MRLTSLSAILASLASGQEPDNRLPHFSLSIATVFPHLVWGDKVVTHRARNRRRKAKRVKALAAQRRRQ